MKHKKIFLISGGGLVFAVLATLFLIPGEPSADIEDNGKALVEKSRLVPRSGRQISRIIDPAAAVKERALLANNLSEKLTELEFKELIEFVKESPNGIYEYEIKNNILNSLRTHVELENVLMLELKSIILDVNQDIVIRSYATQHLGVLYERNHDETINVFLQEIIDSNNNDVGGTALVTLSYLSQEYPDEFDLDTIVGKAWGYLKSPDTQVNNLISAIQIAGRKPNSEYVVYVREYLARKEIEHPVIFSLLAAIGEVGDESDLANLQKIASSKKLESIAAGVAIKKIEKRKSL